MRHYKAIAFDFDGTLVESIEMKTEAFRELFSEQPEKWEEIREYHLTNEGISREVKIPYIYREILNMRLSPKRNQYLVDKYSVMVYEKMLSAPFVEGAYELLSTGRGARKQFIASGTPQSELRRIFDERDLSKFFDGVYGSPESKVQIVKSCSEKMNIPTDEMLFVGDAQSDYDAAISLGMDFVWRKRDFEPKKIIADKVFVTVGDMFELIDLLRE